VILPNGLGSSLQTKSSQSYTVHVLATHCGFLINLLTLFERTHDARPRTCLEISHLVAVCECSSWSPPAPRSSLSCPKTPDLKGSEPR